jgi:hypothetical protein
MGTLDIVFIVVSIIFVGIVFATKSTKYHSYGLKRPDVHLKTDKTPPEKPGAPGKPTSGTTFRK